MIENKTGAGSIIAAVAVQKAVPDGYTLLMAPTPTMAVNVSLYKSLPYEPLTDFVPLALLAQTPFILIVNPALPVKSVTELIAYAKANAGKMSFASVGPGVPHHLYMELFKSMTGIEASHVPYRGSLPALNDVIAGHVPMMFVDIGPATGALQAGTVRPLGVSSTFRIAGFTDIPPIAEVGLPDFEAVGWQMLVAPAKTPRPIVDRLNRELSDILAQPETKEQIAQIWLRAGRRTSRSKACRTSCRSEIDALGQGRAATPASPDRNSSASRPSVRRSIGEGRRCGMCFVGP